MAQKHLKSVHKCDKDFKCNECDMKWVSHLSLELHFIESHKKIMFSCDICGYTTHQASIVRRHKKNTHEGARDHVCHVCGKSFTRSWMVVEHMAVDHDIGECRFKCEYCGKRCNSKDALDKHVEGNHEKDKVYQCDLCPYFGHSKYTLQKHDRRKHKGKKD